LTVAAAVVLVLILVAALAPAIMDLAGVGGPNVRSPGSLNALGAPTGPSSAHPLGVDGMGRDVLARLLYGLRTSIAVGVLGALIATALGALVRWIACLPSSRWPASPASNTLTPTPSRASS
jgi:peptide/nickel transport system permease protein